MFNHAFAYVMSVLVADRKDERGATVVEYALVIGLVSVVLVAGWAALGTEITTMIGGINFTAPTGG